MRATSARSFSRTSTAESRTLKTDAWRASTLAVMAFAVQILQRDCLVFSDDTVQFSTPVLFSFCFRNAWFPATVLHNDTVDHLCTVTRRVCTVSPFSVNKWSGIDAQARGLFIFGGSRPKPWGVYRFRGFREEWLRNLICSNLSGAIRRCASAIFPFRWL